MRDPPALNFSPATLLIVVGVASVFKIRQSNKELDQARIERTALELQIADAREENDLMAERLRAAC
jgi:hypothetical protein